MSIRSSRPTLVYRNVYLNVSKYIPPRSPFLLTLFNVLDRFYRERQARSLARTECLFFFSPYCLHLVPVSITLAPVRLTGRDDDAAASALSRVALLSVACAELLRRAKHLGRRTRTPTDPPSFAREIPSDLLAARSDRSRSLRRNSRARLEKALPLGPLARSIDPSIDVANFPSSERSHWIRDDPRRFTVFFSRSFRKKK